VERPRRVVRVCLPGVPALGGCSPLWGAGGGVGCSWVETLASSSSGDALSVSTASRCRFRACPPWVGGGGGAGCPGGGESGWWLSGGVRHPVGS
jgi:hypothetical protein